jgi:hypothetical protein
MVPRPQGARKPTTASTRVATLSPRRRRLLPTADPTERRERHRAKPAIYNTALERSTFPPTKHFDELWTKLEASRSTEGGFKSWHDLTGASINQASHRQRLPSLN